MEGFAIYTDITERKDRQRALAQRTALLEAQAEASRAASTSCACGPTTGPQTRRVTVVR